MANPSIATPVELSDAELDLVTGGARQNAGAAAAGAAVGGLLAAGAGVAANVQANVEDVGNNTEIVKNVFINVL